MTVEVVPTPVPFPSISMCNMRNLDVYILNTLNRKFLESPLPASHLDATESEFIRHYMNISAKYAPLWYIYQETYPHKFQEVFSRTTYSANIPQDIISSAAVQLEEFIVNCYLGGHPCSRPQDFVKFFDPYYFNCFTYNAPQSGDTALSEGIENGWSSIVFSGSGMLDKNSDIRVLPGLHESRSSVSASEGVRVVIHPPGTIPFPFTEGFDVPPGFSASFGIRPRRIKRIGPPHGNCTDSNPFGMDGTIVDQGNSYRMMSCQKMCLQNYIIQSCGCKDIALPDIPGVSASPCRHTADFPDHCMINASEECLQHFLSQYTRIQCIRNTKEAITKNSTLMDNCNCFPPCDEILYDVSYSLSKWPASGYEGDAAYFDVFYVEHFRERFLKTPKFNMVASYFTDATREHTMTDFARLNVYIADSNVIITQELEDYTSTQLVSDIGGQLGLWIGISIITLAEVIELVCDLCRLAFTAKRKEPRRNHYALGNRNSTNHCNNLYISAVDSQDSSAMILTGHHGDGRHGR